jgi:hypothetical protein
MQCIRAGLEIYGRTSLKAIHISESNNGLAVFGSAIVTVEDSTFSENGGGIDVLYEYESAVTLRRTQIISNQWDGIRLSREAKATIIDSTIKNTAAGA